VSLRYSIGGVGERLPPARVSRETARSDFALIGTPAPCQSVSPSRTSDRRRPCRHPCDSFFGLVIDRDPDAAVDGLSCSSRFAAAARVMPRSRDRDPAPARTAPAEPGGPDTADRALGLLGARLQTARIGDKLGNDLKRARH
jgi:hypothetical protein